MTTESKMLLAYQLTYTEYKHYVDMHFISPDGHLHLRANKEQSEKPALISHILLTIDEKIAKRVGYDYEADPTLYFYRKRRNNDASIGDAIGQRQSSCSLVCGTVALLICFLGPFGALVCGLIGVWTCSWICDPPCVGDGC